MNDVARGLLIITHSGFAMMGLAAVSLVVTLWVQPPWLHTTEATVVTWLRDRQVLLFWLPENTAKRTTALSLQDLPPSQAAVAIWLGRKYKVAPEPLAALVAEAHALSKQTKLAPNLILAVMAIESNFHPYAQSHAGAQGLMQVMTNTHAKRYEAYGGRSAAFDPIANLRVGAAVLADAIKLRDDSVEDGLRFYLGGYGLTEDDGYVAKVFSEKALLNQVAAGHNPALP